MAFGRSCAKDNNCVVTLTKQEQMKDSPQYGAAVQSLQIQKCTLEDMELFNTCVIRSVTNEKGIDMSTLENFSAAAIVRNQPIARGFESQKAMANCACSNKQPVICAAVDICATHILSHCDHEHLLNMNVI